MYMNHYGSNSTPSGDRTFGDPPITRKPRKPLPVAWLVACDIVLTGVSLCAFALFHHALPRAYAVDQSSSRVYTRSAHATDTVSVASLKTSPRS